MTGFQKEIENFLGSKLFRLAAKNAASWWYWVSNLDFTHTACSQFIKICALPSNNNYQNNKVGNCLSMENLVLHVSCVPQSLVTGI
jgi:hypothetical protein